MTFTSVAGTIVREWLTASGERDLLRPSLVLWAAEACGHRTDDVLPVAAAFAFVDCFMRLHDELVERRAESGTLARFGLGQSLNGGDALYALALRSLADDVLKPERRLRAARLVGSSVLIAIEGRNIDVARNARGARDGLLAHVRSVRRRSAALTGAALQAGALLAGAADRVTRAFDRAGRLLGVASSADPDVAPRLGRKAYSAVARCTADARSLAAFDEVIAFVASPA